MRINKIGVSLDSYKNIGFPDYFATSIEKPIYRNDNRSFAWKTKEMILYSSLSNMNNIIIDLPNDQFFIRRFSNSKNVSNIALRSQSCKAELFFRDKLLQKISLKSLGGALQEFDTKDKYFFDNLTFNMKANKVILGEILEDILEINIDIYNIRLNKFWKNILENNIKYLKANFYLRNPSKFSDVPNLQKFTTRGYDTTEFIIDKISLEHPLSQFHLTGLVNLDNEMMLNGEVKLTISDYQKLLKFLTKKGVITPQIAKNFRLMLSFLLSTRTLQNNDGSVDVDLTIKKNIVYRENIRLFEIAI